MNNNEYINKNTGSHDTHFINAFQSLVFWCAWFTFAVLHILKLWSAQKKKYETL